MNFHIVCICLYICRASTACDDDNQDAGCIWTNSPVYKTFTTQCQTRTECARGNALVKETDKQSDVPKDTSFQKNKQSDKNTQNLSNSNLHDVCDKMRLHNNVCDDVDSKIQTNLASIEISEIDDDIQNDLKNLIVFLNQLDINQEQQKQVKHKNTTSASEQVQHHAHPPLLYNGIYNKSNYSLDGIYNTPYDTLNSHIYEVPYGNEDSEYPTLILKDHDVSGSKYGQGACNINTGHCFSDTETDNSRSSGTNNVCDAYEDHDYSTIDTHNEHSYNDSTPVSQHEYTKCENKKIKVIERDYNQTHDEYYQLQKEALLYPYTASCDQHENIDKFKSSVYMPLYDFRSTTYDTPDGCTYKSMYYRPNKSIKQKCVKYLRLFRCTSRPTSHLEKTHKGLFDGSKRSDQWTYIQHARNPRRLAFAENENSSSTN